MSITFAELLDILAITSNYSSLSFKIILKMIHCVEINSIDDLTKLISTVGAESKTSLLCELLERGMLNKIEKNQLSEFVISFKTKYNKSMSDKNILHLSESFLKIFPEFLIDILNFINDGTFNDTNKLNLITSTISNNDILLNLIESLGISKHNIAELMTNYFNDVAHYEICCKSFNIEENIYKQYIQIVINDANKIIIFENTLNYDYLCFYEWYSFKHIIRGQTIIVNIKKKSSSSKVFSYERYIIDNKSKSLINSWNGEVNLKGGVIFDESSLYFKCIK